MMNEETEEERLAYSRGWLDGYQNQQHQFEQNKKAILDRLEREGYLLVEKELTFGDETFKYKSVVSGPQIEIRNGRPPKSFEDCVTATLEALIIQGSINAWDGDGVSCVAQMIWTMHKRAEKAEQELARLQKP
jgi:hypothetical protein